MPPTLRARPNGRRRSRRRAAFHVSDNTEVLRSESRGLEVRGRQRVLPGLRLLTMCFTVTHRDGAARRGRAHHRRTASSRRRRSCRSARRAPSRRSRHAISTKPARDHSRQHLSPAPAARRRADRAARRAAPLHRLGRGRSSPTAAATRCSAWRHGGRSPRTGAEFQSHLDGCRASADARIGRGHPGAISAPTSRWCSTNARLSRLRAKPRMRSMALTARWARRGRERFLERARDRPTSRATPARLQFGIVQGGIFPELRDEERRC